MIVAGGLVLYTLGFWVPTLLPRPVGIAVALCLLAGCVAIVVQSAQHVPSRTHFDIAREAGTATGVFLAVAPAAAIVFLARLPAAEQRASRRIIYLAVAVCLSAAAGFVSFSFAFPRV